MRATEFITEVTIDNVKGAGAVPYNQEIDYFGLRVKMKPSIFLKLALPLGQPHSAELEKYIADGGAIGSPFLEIKIPPEWDDGDFSKFAQVAGHEGRNRITAVKKLEGDEPIEVHLIPRGGLRARDLTAEFVEKMQEGMYAERSTHLVSGPLFSTSSVNENIELDELDPNYVNNTIEKGGAGKWVPPGGRRFAPQGVTASVWQHVADPDTVVKVVGGGAYQAEKHHLDGTVAYVDFLVHNGYKSTHLPIVHGIDIGNEVVQVRIETLQELNIKMGRELGNLASYVRNGMKMSNKMFKPLSKDNFNNLLKQQGLSERNSYDSIVECIKLLNTARIAYGKKYSLHISLDLHGGNWLLRRDGTLVAADPWYSGDFGKG